jgi:Pup amidohydrolase
MSIPKLAGLETEFAIAGDERQRASALVVRAYPWISLAADPAPSAGPAGTENPSFASCDGNDRMLPNGARFYVDHAHPEYSTPECLDPVTLVALDRAGNEIARRCAALASRSEQQMELRLYKNNSDHQGHSYGCHENYLMDAGTYAALFGQRSRWITACLIPFLVSRIVVTGAGKAGAENGEPPVDFQISQRADFLEDLVGLQTTYKRPIVNTRDEPHADPLRFRRLHVICGDANLCPWAAWLKVGTMQVLLRLLEDGALDDLDLTLDRPLKAVREISRDPEARRPVRLWNGSAWTAIDLQSAFLERARDYFADPSHPPGEAEARLLQGWGETLHDLREQPLALIGRLDWVTKHRLLEDLARQQHWDKGSPHRREADLQYHALEPAESLFASVEEAGLVVPPPGWDPGAVARFLREPPPDSRAYLRGECIARFSGAIQRMDWEEVVFGTARVRLPDPAEGGREGIAHLERHGTSGELLQALAEALSGLAPPPRQPAASYWEQGVV